MVLAGLNLPGADLNSQRLARRAAYMDVCCNPVTRTLDARLRGHDVNFPDYSVPPQARQTYSGQLWGQARYDGFFMFNGTAVKNYTLSILEISKFSAHHPR